MVAKIRAVDPDEGPNAELDYRILDGDGLGTFSITTDPDTQEGLITLHKVPERELVRHQFSISLLATREPAGVATLGVRARGAEVQLLVFLLQELLCRNQVCL